MHTKLAASEHALAHFYAASNSRGGCDESNSTLQLARQAKFKCASRCQVGSGANQTGGRDFIALLQDQPACQVEARLRALPRRLAANFMRKRKVARESCKSAPMLAKLARPLLNLKLARRRRRARAKRQAGSENAHERPFTTRANRRLSACRARASASTWLACRLELNTQSVWRPSLLSQTLGKQPSSGKQSGFVSDRVQARARAQLNHGAQVGG